MKRISPDVVYAELQVCVQTGLAGTLRFMNFNNFAGPQTRWTQRFPELVERKTDSTGITIVNITSEKHDWAVCNNHVMSSFPMKHVRAHARMHTSTHTIKRNKDLIVLERA